MAKVHGITYSSGKTPPDSTFQATRQGATIIKFSHGQLSILKFNKESLHTFYKSNPLAVSRASSFLCRSRKTKNIGTEECVKHCSEFSDTSNSRGEGGDGQYVHSLRIVDTNQALAEACKFAYNDAKYVKERARKDIVLLSRGIMKLDTRARQDVAILGSGFLKLDARAREDTEKVDNGANRRAEHLHHIASKFKNNAQSTLKSAADRHWSDGALEADLRRADFIAKQRAMEDSLMALEFIKDVLDMMVSRMYELKNSAALSADEMAVQVTLEKNGKGLDIFTGEVSADRIIAIQEAYWDVASALSEADGIDYTNSEELELLVATLMDLDAMDGIGRVFKFS